MSAMLAFWSLEGPKVCERRRSVGAVADAPRQHRGVMFRVLSFYYSASQAVPLRGGTTSMGRPGRPMSACS